jgi:monoamine oxidase
LTVAGRETIVLEARQRIGGRIATDRGFASVPVELGAEFLHGSTIVTWALVATTGAQTWPAGTPHERTPDGRWVPIGQRHDHLGIAEDAPPPREDEDAANYLRRSGFVAPHLPTKARLFDADSEGLHRWSATLLDEAGLLSAGASTADDHHLAGGYDELLAPLADDLDIRLGHEVVRIGRSGSGVEVVCEVGGDRHTLSTDACVITLPIGVLQAGVVDVDPPLPPAKQRAIAALGSGDAIKLLYHLPHPAFPAELTMVDDRSLLPSVWWVAARSPKNPVRGEVVVGWATGEGARRLLDAGSLAALQTGLTALRELVGDTDLTPIDAVSYDWRADAFARGAYSYAPPGAELAYEALAEPTDGCLFWAGEATNAADPMTVHGAVDSGWRAAEQIVGHGIAMPD